MQQVRNLEVRKDEEGESREQNHTNPKVGCEQDCFHTCVILSAVAIRESEPAMESKDPNADALAGLQGIL